MVAEGGREVGKAIEMEENKLTSSWIFFTFVYQQKKKKTKLENLTHSEQTMFYLFLKASRGMNANWEGDVCKFMQIHLQISTYHQSLGTFPASLCWAGAEEGLRRMRGRGSVVVPPGRTHSPGTGVAALGLFSCCPFLPPALSASPPSVQGHVGKLEHRGKAGTDTCSSICWPSSSFLQQFYLCIF